MPGEGRGKLLLVLFLLTGAAWVLHRELAGFHIRDLQAALDGIPSGRVLLAFVLCGLGYLQLSAIDALALEAEGASLPWPRVALASFVANSLSYSVGLSVLSGGAVRYRFYSAWGVEPAAIARVVAFSTAGLWLGLAGLAGAALACGPAAALARLPLPAAASRGAGLVLLLGSLAYLAATRRPDRALRVGGLRLELPAPRAALGQLGISALDWALAARVAWVLLPPAAGIGFPEFLTLYLAAATVGILSQVPGGVGVFEALLVEALGATVPVPALLASLLLFRVVYYLVPLLLASAALLGFELLQRREAVGRVARAVEASVAPLVPAVAALGCFLGGAVLLVSGATPADPERIPLLARVLALPVVELSHFLGSVVGLCLLILARGLERRLDGAYTLALLGLGVGAVASLAKGLDWEEAVFLLALLAGLLPFRDQFYRRASIFGERYTPGWFVAIAAVLAASVWLGVFSYRHLEYRHELWWQFSHDADAPRFLRSLVGLLTVVLIFGLRRLLRPTVEPRPLPSPDELAAAGAIVAASPVSLAHLVRTRDKSILFDESRSAFLMYAVEGRSWIAMGDPVGPRASAAELVWEFRNLVDRADGWPVFYQVRPDTLPLYVDLGLGLVKLGEQASVALPDFGLEGGGRKALRQAVTKAEREGLEFALVEPPAVEPLLPRLREVSDAWSAGLDTREKGFSVGRFDDQYLREGPVAVVRRRDGALVAFANLWTSSARVELSVDLMRHRPEAPGGTMDYLFCKTMLWGKAQGYRRFDLGMAPLSGLGDDPLAPLWSRLAALLFRHGEALYNFQGLRAWKDKFHPDWEARYLAFPGGLALPFVVSDLATLIAGGIRGTVTK